MGGKVLSAGAMRRRPYRYRLVDVFTQVPLQGNQLAVLPDATGLEEDSMQRIAREFNLAETTFVFPASLSGCVAEVRIFTPTREMRFAGHPTIGTSFVLIEEGRVESPATEFTLQEKIGPIAIRVAREEGELIWLRTPEIGWGRTYEPALCATALGLAPEDLMSLMPQRLSAGNPTLYVAVCNTDAVDRAALGVDGMRTLRGSDSEPFCVYVFAPLASGAYARMFAPDHGVAEDPATGSSAGPLVAYMIRHELASSSSGTRLAIQQGVKMQRRSLLHAQIQGPGGSTGIDIGGHVTAVGEGTIYV